MQTQDIVDHWTVERVGRKLFHLEVADVGHEMAQLHIILSIENVPEKVIVDYEFPPDFRDVLVAMSEVCPMHMVSFEEQDGEMYLANAASVWGHVCPCGL